MRIFIDAEFIEDGHTIDLISIGLVAEDGRELYLQSAEFDPHKASAWIQENVFPHLEECLWANIAKDSRAPFLADIFYHKRNGQCVDQHRGMVHNCPWRTREQIKNEVMQFMDPTKYGKPELWGWCAGYDWVALCQLFGTMMDLPDSYPHYVHEVQQILDVRGISDDQLPMPGGQAHNALTDARQIQNIWKFLNERSYKVPYYVSCHQPQSSGQ